MAFFSFLSLEGRDVRKLQLERVVEALVRVVC